MTVPKEVDALIERLNSELNQLEQGGTEGLNLVRFKLNLFQDNAILIQLFAYLNNVLLFAEIVRRSISYSSAILATGTVTDEQVREIAEDLSEQLGRVLEAKVAANRIRERLGN
jgi:hypothetical protein